MLLLSQNSIITKDDEKLKLNIQYTIMIKEADKNDEIIKLLKRAKKLDLDMAVFTREIIETTNDKKVIKLIKDKKLEDV